jgi:hypothetical protein
MAVLKFKEIISKKKASAGLQRYWIIMAKSHTVEKSQIELPFFQNLSRNCD